MLRNDSYSPPFKYKSSTTWKNAFSSISARQPNPDPAHSSRMVTTRSYGHQDNARGLLRGRERLQLPTMDLLGSVLVFELAQSWVSPCWAAWLGRVQDSTTEAATVSTSLLCLILPSRSKKHLPLASAVGMPAGLLLSSGAPTSQAASSMLELMIGAFKINFWSGWSILGDVKLICHLRYRSQL